MQVEVGTRIGAYRLEALVGEGGFGQVWRAHDLRLSRTVAVKVLKSAMVGDKAAAARFAREAQSAAGLSHSHIVTIYDVIDPTPDAPAALVMEYLDGQPLSRVGALSDDELIAIGSAIADALGYAHSRSPQLLHRDVGPGNIILIGAGRPGAPAKLVDFGIATAVGQTKFTRTGMFVGNAAYASPEQRGGRHLTAATDVYSLARVLMEHRGSGAAQIASGSALTEVLLRAQQPDAADRYADGAQFSEALRDAARSAARSSTSSVRPRGGTRVTAAQTTAVTQLETVTRSPRRAVLAAAVAAAVIGAVAASGALGGSEGDTAAGPTRSPAPGAAAATNTTTQTTTAAPVTSAASSSADPTTAVTVTTASVAPAVFWSPSDYVSVSGDWPRASGRYTGGQIGGQTVASANAACWDFQPDQSVVTVGCAYQPGTSDLEYRVVPGAVVNLIAGLEDTSPLACAAQVTVFDGDIPIADAAIADGPLTVTDYALTSTSMRVRVSTLDGSRTGGSAAVCRVLVGEHA